MKFDLSTQQIDFKKRRALVTGAGKGIGREIAVMLRRCNAQVVAVSRTQSDLEALQKEIDCETIVADLGKAAEARQIAEQAGDVDLLVNNAAIAILEPFLQTKVESWDTTMAINLRAAFIVSQAVASG
jgi:L-xylulose reductase